MSLLQQPYRCWFMNSAIGEVIMMLDDTEKDARTYRVVVNDEEQYSIWLDYLEIPLGWNDVGVSGTKEHCLKHIEEVWTDMRPRSLRVAMEQRDQT